MERHSLGQKETKGRQVRKREKEEMTDRYYNNAHFLRAKFSSRSLWK